MPSGGACPRKLPRIFQGFLEENVPLSQYTSLRLGGPSRYYAEPRSVEELGALVRHCWEAAIPVRLLGGGSNCLVPDEGFDGVVVRLSAPAFGHLTVSANGISAGSGLKLSKVIAVTIRRGLGGLEKLAGIPGTLGGALWGNAGTRMGDIGSLISAVAVMECHGWPSWRQASTLAFAYRKSNLRGTIILACQLNLVEENPTELARRNRMYWQQKKTRQPYDRPSAGCIFKNPGALSAGELIDLAGLRGARIGGAHVSERHANFIIADHGATSYDALRLIDHVRDVVAKRFNLVLETEIDIW